MHVFHVVPRCKNARFSYGSCTSTPERGVAPKCSQPGGHFRWIYGCFSLGRAHLSPPRQNQNPCTPPMMRNQVGTKGGPARPRTGAAPCGRSFPARFWFTLSGGAGERAGHQNHGEENDLTRKLNRRPYPAAHRQQLPPRCRHPVAAYKNVRFTLELCTSDPFPHCTKMHVSGTRLAHPDRNPPASQSVHNSPPVGGRFPPFPSHFSFGTALNREGVQKCTQVQIPVHPNDITEDAVGVGT